MIKAFKVMSNKEQVMEKVEKKRDKGGGFLKKKPEEKLAYLRLLYLPGVFFQYQYLKKKGIMGGKVPHRSQAFFVTHPSIAWDPKAAKQIMEKGTVEVKEGFYIPVDQGQAETWTTTNFGLMRSGRVTREQVRAALNLDAEPDDLQTPTEISIVYIPWWVAKLETPGVTRYLVYATDGSEDERMTTAFNTDYDFVLGLEQEVRGL